MSRSAAVLGLGERGMRWAKAFHDAGWRVRGFDPDPAAQGLPPESRGWRRESTISKTVASADWVVCCVPDRLELMQKVIHRAQAEAPETAILAVSTRTHDVEAVQGCAIRPSRVGVISDVSPATAVLEVSARNPQELRVDMLAVLSEVGSVSLAATDAAAEATQSRDARSA